MNKEDFERLKAVCEKEGFELLKSLPDKDTNFHILAVSKKDIWDGVEYAAVENDSEPIYKIVKNGLDTIQIISRGLVDDSTQGEIKESPKKNFKPSTESAYIEQLKKEFEDRGIRKFKIRNTDISMMDGGCLKDPLPEFIYRKDTDTLYFHGVPVYQQGKWATRVKERVEVDPKDILTMSSPFAFGTEFKFALANRYIKDLDQFKEFLASQLEKYLNGEVE